MYNVKLLNSTHKYVLTVGSYSSVYNALALLEDDLNKLICTGQLKAGRYFYTITSNNGDAEIVHNSGGFNIKLTKELA